MSKSESIEARTLSALWLRALSEARPTPAFLVKQRGEWRDVSWDDAGRSVEELAAGFLSLGIGKGDRVAILSRTRLEWTLSDWALIAIGALVVPIYPTSPALECAYVLGNSGARFVICEDAGQLAKVAPARRELEVLEQLIVLDEESESDAVSLTELRERGRALLASDPEAVDRARARIREDDALTIVYTSGTTGPPKGCILTNRNYFAMVEMVRRVGGLIEPGDQALLFLPLAHTFARLVQFLGAATGLTIAFCPEPALISEALREVGPTIFPSVPRLYERLAAAIRAGFDEQRRLRRWLAGWALGVGYRAGARRRDRRRYPLRLVLELGLADRLVFRRVRERLGGRLRIAISGGAPLPLEIAEFFDALGLLVLEGYGLTECTAGATLNRPDRYRLGTVGQALVGVDLRIAPDGEILVRGENVFAGYYRDEEATRAVLGEDGWLRTGDLGVLDAEGFLTITDRKKDIIVTSGGENVSPQNVETALEALPYVAQALVVGDRRAYLVALLVLDEAGLSKAARTEEEARALLEQAIADVNRAHGPAEHVRRFAVIPRPFSEEESELTPTLKPRRHVCEEHFREEIERLYTRA
jgi:Long-chain acyl-CoA synthetases (AMP-forming)